MVRLDGADWRRPEGPGSSIERRFDNTPDSATGHMGFRCALTMH